MGTLPGAAPTKADLDAADRTPRKELNLQISHTRGRGRANSELEMKMIGTKQASKQINTGELGCACLDTWLFRPFQACVAPPRTAPAFTPKTQLRLRLLVTSLLTTVNVKLPGTGERGNVVDGRCRRTSGNPSLSLRNTRTLHKISDTARPRRSQC
jgi:hypothetical protein